MAASSVVAEIEPDEIELEPEAPAPRRPSPPAPRVAAPPKPPVAPQVVAPAPAAAPVAVAPTIAAAPIVAPVRPAPRAAITAPAVPHTPWGVATHPAAASSAALSPAASQTSMPRKLPAWWRVTALSAGASAALTFAIVMIASDPASASTTTPVEAPAPIAVSYDPSLLEQPAPAPVVAAPVGVAESERVLARRIALRGTRNAAGGLPRLARSAFEEALQHDPDCRPALAGLGRIFFDAGRMREAATHLEHALRIEPRDSELREMLAKAEQKLGHHRSAARHLRRAEDNR